MQTMFDIQLICESSIIVATCPRQLDLRLFNHRPDLCPDLRQMIETIIRTKMGIDDDRDKDNLKCINNEKRKMSSSRISQRLQPLDIFSRHIIRLPHTWHRPPSLQISPQSFHLFTVGSIQVL